MVLMAHDRNSNVKIPPEDEAGSDSDTKEVVSKEVFFDITHSELTSSLLEILEKHDLLKIEFKELKNSHEFIPSENNKLKVDLSILSE